MAFCAYYLEFIVDLLSQLPTRRFVRAILGDANIFVKANLTINEMRSDEEGADGNVNLLKQLLEMAKDFYDFEVDDHTGDALSERRDGIQTFKSHSRVSTLIVQALAG